jgi:predicted GIY-YIG superfamily endonuclease
MKRRWVTVESRPPISGVYVLISRKRIIYVGKSKNIDARVLQHRDVATRLRGRGVECITLKSHEQVMVEFGAAYEASE